MRPRRPAGSVRARWPGGRRRRRGALGSALFAVELAGGLAGGVESAFHAAFAMMGGAGVLAMAAALSADGRPAPLLTHRPPVPPPPAPPPLRGSLPMERTALSPNAVGPTARSLSFGGRLRFRRPGPGAPATSVFARDPRRPWSAAPVPAPAGARPATRPGAPAARPPRRAASSAPVPSPQANSSSGSAPASATSAASPTLVCRAEDTTQGRPQASRHGQRPAHPAQRRALEHGHVRGPGDGHPQRVLGAPDRLVGRDPHDTRRRTAASSSIPGTAARRTAGRRPPGRAPGSRPPPRRPTSAALASTRTAPPGPSASRTAATRSRSAGSDPGASATLTLAVRQPGRGDDRAARAPARPPARCS